MALTREQILARKVAGNTEAFPIDGDEVIIRGLTRNEALQLRGMSSVGDMDNLMISMAMVEPTMTPEDVAAWGDAGAAGTLIQLSLRISELSGIQEGAGKSGVPRTRKRS